MNRIASANRPEPAHPAAAANAAFTLLWLFIFSIAWEDQVMFESFGTASRLIGAAATLAGLFAFIDRGTLPAISPLQVLILLPVMWGWLSIFWTIDLALSAGRGFTYLQLVIMFFLVSALAARESQQRSLMQAFVLGTYVSGGATIVKYISKDATYYQRYTAAGFNPADLALILAISMPFAYYLSNKSASAVLRWVNRLQPVLAMSAILVMATRGAFVAGLAGIGLLLVLAFPRLPAMQKLIWLLAVVVAVACAIRYTPQTSRERLASIGSEIRGGTLGERMMLWKAGLSMFEENVALGIGSAAYPVAAFRSVGIMKVAHNTFISVLVEEGIIGLTLFLAMLAGMTACIFRMPQAERSLWCAVMLAWTIGVMTLTWEHRKPTWVIYSLVAAQARTLQYRTFFGRLAGPRPDPAGRSRITRRLSPV